MPLGPYYRRCAIPKPEIRAVTRKRRALQDAQAERICRDVTRKRDHGRCRIPGCRGGARALHHIVYRSTSRIGLWQTRRVCWLCVDHHRLEHAGAITIAGNADRPGGLVITGDVNLLRKVRL